MSELTTPTDQPAPDQAAPVLHLDRAIVAGALASDEPLWAYIPPIGWLRIAFYDRGADASPSSVAAIQPAGSDDVHITACV